VKGHDRLSPGPIAGGAIKLTPDNDVTTCLGIGEGLGSTLSLQLAQEFGTSPGKEFAPIRYVVPGYVAEGCTLLAEASNPRLIIVDVLAMFKPPRGAKDNQYEADYHAIEGLQALASEFQAAIVVVHHTRKGGSDGDPFEKVSGTLGLSGAADTTFILDRDGNGATIYGRGRDIESAVEFNKGSCRWFVMGQASEVRRSDERSEILALLEDADDLMSPTLPP
jgi:AAA domain